MYLWVCFSTLGHLEAEHQEHGMSKVPRINETTHTTIFPTKRPVRLEFSVFTLHACSLTKSSVHIHNSRRECESDRALVSDVRVRLLCLIRLLYVEVGKRSQRLVFRSSRTLPRSRSTIGKADPMLNPSVWGYRYIETGKERRILF